MPFAPISQKDEAAYEALGCLSVLYRDGDIPKCLRDIVRAILIKAGDELDEEAA